MATWLPDDVWLLAVLAMGGIFFGYTIAAAVLRPAQGLAEPPGRTRRTDGFEPGQRTKDYQGHDLLDALGFD